MFYIPSESKGYKYIVLYETSAVVAQGRRTATATKAEDGLTDLSSLSMEWMKR